MQNLTPKPHQSPQDLTPKPPEVGVRCVSSARGDLCGVRRAIAVPTATKRILIGLRVRIERVNGDSAYDR